MKLLYNNIGIDLYNTSLFSHPDYNINQIETSLQSSSLGSLSDASLKHFGTIIPSQPNKIEPNYKSRLHGYSCYLPQYEKGLISYSQNLLTYVNSNNIDTVILSELCEFNYTNNFSTFTYSCRQLYQLSDNLKRDYIDAILKNTLANLQRSRDYAGYFLQYVLDNPGLKDRVANILLREPNKIKTVIENLPADKNNRHYVANRSTFITTHLSNIVNEITKNINTSRKMFLIGSNKYKMKFHPGVYSQLSSIIVNNEDKYLLDKEIVGVNKILNYVQVVQIEYMGKTIDILNVHKRQLSDKYPEFYNHLYELIMKMINTYKSNNIVIVGDFNNTDRTEIILTDKFVRKIDLINNTYTNKFGIEKRVTFYIPSLKSRVYDRALQCFEKDNDSRSGLKTQHMGLYCYLTNYYIKNINPVDCKLATRLSSHISYTFELEQKDFKDDKIMGILKEKIAKYENLIKDMEQIKDTSKEALPVGIRPKHRQHQQKLDQMNFFENAYKTFFK